MCKRNGVPCACSLDKHTRGGNQLACTAANHRKQVYSHCLYGMGMKAHLCAMRENKVGLCGVGDQLRPTVTFNQE